MADVPGAAAVLVGDGPEEARLREETKVLGLEGRVHFAGLRTDLENFYPVATAFVMPCLDESMGVVIYDALTCKLPVVAYDRGSIAEIVTDRVNGYLLQPDPQALAAALRSVLAKETAFRFLDAQSYSAVTMVERHHALYEELSCRWFGAPSGRSDD
jgi:glycosyltransferase involved in cell wall biosynthesis